MALASLKPTARTITLLAAITAFLFFGCAGAFMFANSKLKEAQSALKSKQQEVEDSRRIAQRLADAEAAYRSAQAQLGKLEKSVSERAYVPTLLRQIEQLGVATHLKVTSIRPAVPEAAQAKKPASASGQEAEPDQEKSNQAQAAKPEPPKPYDTQPIDIEVSGSYWNVMSFLYQITSFPKILEVNSVDLEPSAPAQTPGSPKLLAKLKLNAFIFKSAQPPPISQTGSAVPAATKNTPEAKA